MVDVLGPDERREIERLRRALQLGKGPEFHMIVGDTRRVVDAALSEVLPGVTAPQETVAPEEPPKAFAVRWMRWLEAAIHAGGAQPLVLDAWDVDPEHNEHWAWIFGRLNERRNEIMRGIGRPFLLLVSPDNERLLGRTAPDLWSIRGVGMRLHDRGMVEATPRGHEEVVIAPLPRPPSTEELKLQQQRVVRARAAGNPLTRAIEAIRMAQSIHESGPHRGPKALTYADEAIALYEALATDRPEHEIDLARALQRRAEIAAGVGRRDLAIIDLQRSITLLGGSESSELRDLRTSFIRLGDMYRALDRAEEARAWDERATAISERLATLEPDRAGSKARSDAPSVFIAYSHDSGLHEERVLALADQLRADGIDARLDQYTPAPPEGWPKWMERQLANVDFVLLVCTPTFRRRFDREETPGEGLGVAWEGMIAQQLLYEAGARNTRLLPVVFEDAHMQDIPLSLRAFTHYRLFAGYEALLRRITNHPRRPTPALGQPRMLAPDPRPSLFGGGMSVDNRNANIAQVVNVGANATFGAMTTTMPAAPPMPPPTPTAAPPATILLFTANAVDPSRRLELEEELRAILDALRHSRARDRFHPTISPSVTFTQVIHDIDDRAPAIVHFGGHGHRLGKLIFRGRDEAEQAVTPELIATLLASLHTPPALVVFATCYSDALAAAAAEHVPYAIGFRGEVEDHMLPRFSATLYERLAARPMLDVPHAFGLAKLAVTAEGFITAEQAWLFARPSTRETTESLPI